MISHTVIVSDLILPHYEPKLDDYLNMHCAEATRLYVTEVIALYCTVGGELAHIKLRWSEQIDLYCANDSHEVLLIPRDYTIPLDPIRDWCYGNLHEHPSPGYHAVRGQFPAKSHGQHFLRWHRQTLRDIVLKPITQVVLP